ncbi:uncharacterized protein OCT59_003407 [Rhizophagus irregularis]|uniref:uncharacterized protein n=1 Tax=Rhizophagus irregularis TaxID=588596 RepID=UPI000CAB0EFC|nr:hypothetical protein OCT59_003407 [Rhizophagus irregularis]GBC37348.1 hypothetical protein GLOIN_2v1477507 [Rhizophagus irregularis DAOM 181602=DAOM 197198]CAG8643925.1 22806_t:CDS:2 [Rhizophagus irregularis]
MQRLPPAGWSRHHLVYPHRCFYCSPNSNPSEYTRPISRLSEPPIPMPEPFHFPDTTNNFTKNLRKYHSNDRCHCHFANYNNIRASVNDSIIAVSPVSDRESISITINDEKSEKGIKIKRKKSPMDNPPWWRRVYWIFLTILNFYALIGSIALIVNLCLKTNPFGSYQNVVSNYVFIIITTLELAPCAANIYQIHQCSKGKLRLCEVLAIIIGKKELYFLYGKTHLTQKQINKMEHMTDALCFIYWIFLSYQIALEIQKNMGHSVEFIILNDRVRLLIFTLLLAATLSILRILWTLLKKCVYFVDKLDY